MMKSSGKPWKAQLVAFSPPSLSAVLCASSLARTRIEYPWQPERVLTGTAGTVTGSRSSAWKTEEDILGRLEIPSPALITERQSIPGTLSS
jgi:hypothetical protein